MINKIYEMIKKYIKENWIFLLIWLFTLIICFIRLPYVIYSPGSSIGLENRIIVQNEYNYNGNLKMAYVTMRKGNLPSILLSFIMPNWDLIKEEDVTIKGQNIDETLQIDRLNMQEAMDNATIVAYQKSGNEISITKQTLNVIYISNEAKTDLQLLDKIISVNDIAVSSIYDIQNIVKEQEPGNVLKISIIRNNKETEAYATVYEDNGISKIGIGGNVSYEYVTGIPISFKSSNSEAGSSGGLMMALTIYNKLVEEDITNGKTIVGTGTIDIYGNVGKIDGVKYKLLGADKSHADIFLCPTDNYDEAIKYKNEYNLDIKIISVSTFDEALEALNKG